MKYLTKIHWSEEDEAYIATVPVLRGCIAHGDTMEEAAATIRECTKLWLEMAVKCNDPIPEPDLAAEEVARLSGVNPHTLAIKLRRETRFTPEESERLLTAIGRI